MLGLCIFRNVVEPVVSKIEGAPSEVSVEIHGPCFSDAKFLDTTPLKWEFSSATLRTSSLFYIYKFAKSIRR